MLRQQKDIPPLSRACHHALRGVLVLGPAYLTSCAIDSIASIHPYISGLHSREVRSLFGSLIQKAMPVLTKYFKIAAIVPFVVVAIAGAILALTHDGSSYKSEWFTSDGFGETIFLAILLSGFIAILTLPIFLNSLPRIQNNPWFSSLAWFAVPGVLSVFVVYQELINFNTSFAYYGSRLIDGYIMSIGLTHLLCLFFSFVLFRNNSLAN